jgi:hypothetical protein
LDGGKMIAEVCDAEGVECLAIEVLECGDGVESVFDKGEEVLFQLPKGEECIHLVVRVVALLLDVLGCHHRDSRNRMNIK